MRTRRAAFLAVVTSALCIGAASAADLGGSARRPIRDTGPSSYGPAFSWSGLYVGGHVGYAWSDADWQLDAGSTNLSGSGGLAGGQIGYNIQTGNLVFGVEADLSGAWLDGDSACAGGALDCDHSFNWLASVRGRAGIAVNHNRTLLYATAGGAWADVDYTSKDAVTGVAFGSGFSHTHAGWVAGGGIEHMLTPNFTARVEYLYYGFESVTASAGTLGAGPADIDLAAQTVRFGLNFKF